MLCRTSTIPLRQQMFYSPLTPRLAGRIRYSEFLLSLLISTDGVSSKRLSPLSVIYDIVSWEIHLFVITAVTASNGAKHNKQTNKQNKLRGLSPLANYTEWQTAAYR
jgi:hypothetical protein